jgi:hypothetical protein
MAMLLWLKEKLFQKSLLKRRPTHPYFWPCPK